MCSSDLYATFAFFESYFSNYIEGTVFELDEARGALRRLSRSGDPEALVAAMSRLWNFGRWLSCGDFDVLRERLDRSGAFSDDEGRILRFGEDMALWR